MQFKRIAIMALPTLLIALIVGVVTLVTPSSSDAQESPTTTAPESGDEAHPSDESDGVPEWHPFGFHHRGGPHGDGLAAAAGSIGIDLETLVDALRAGDTIAEVASAHGVEASAVIAAIVAEHNERIDAAVAEERITAERGEELKAAAAEHAEQLVNGELAAPEPRLGEFRHHRFGPGCAGVGLEAAADAIGIEVETLTNALGAGDTIADVAAANGVAVDDVVDAIAAEHAARIAEAVADGLIDEERAADLAAQARERAQAMVEGDAAPRRDFEGRHGGRRGPGHFGGRGFDGGFGNQGPGRDVPTATETLNA